MSSGKSEALILLASSLIYAAAPRMIPGALGKFITLAAGLRFLIAFNNLRALCLGLELEDPSHVRDTFYLALVYTLCMFIAFAGSLALLI